MASNAFQGIADEMARLYMAGQYAAALQFVEQNADHFPEQAARTTFWRMCLLSLCGRAQEVIDLFRRSLDVGLWWAESQFLDPDLDAVRGLAEFQSLANESNRKCLEAQDQIEPARTLLTPAETSHPLPLLIALHGRSGDRNSNLEHWEVARQRGWLVLSPQSRQMLFPGGSCWDDGEQGLADILFHMEQVKAEYEIDPSRIVAAGFSQGSGMAVYAALSGRLGARGFIGVGTFIADPDSLLPLAQTPPSVRGYFVTGEKDHTLDSARAVQRILQDAHIPFGEEVFPDLGHAFPPDFESTFDHALKFILE